MREAKVEIFLVICELPQCGQTTWLTALELKTNSSNSRWHSLHVNSYNGIDHPPQVLLQRAADHKSTLLYKV